MNLISGGMFKRELWEEVLLRAIIVNIQPIVYPYKFMIFNEIQQNVGVIFTFDKSRILSNIF